MVLYSEHSQSIYVNSVYINIYMYIHIAVEVGLGLIKGGLAGCHKVG